MDLAPGPPWEHGFAERCLGKGRDAGLHAEVFRSSEAARAVIEGWRREDNRLRPHRVLGDQPPAEKAWGSEWDSVPAGTVVTPSTTGTIQGHRLHCCPDQF